MPNLSGSSSNHIENKGSISAQAERDDQEDFDVDLLAEVIEEENKSLESGTDRDNIQLENENNDQDDEANNMQQDDQRQ